MTEKAMTQPTGTSQLKMRKKPTRCSAESSSATPGSCLNHMSWLTTSATAETSAAGDATLSNGKSATSSAKPTPKESP